MALFKINRGNSATLPAAMTDGWAYFCTDTGEFYIDYADSQGNLHRKQINADEANKLIGYDVATSINNVDTEIPTSGAVADIIAEHTHVISDITNLQTTLDGKAASSHNHSASNITSGTLSSNRLPTVSVTKGGTGATSASAARTNLSVYSIAEIDEQLEVFDDRIVATEENTITDVINIFTPADAGKFLCVADDGSIKAVAFSNVSEVGA